MLYYCFSTIIIVMTISSQAAVIPHLKEQDHHRWRREDECDYDERLKICSPGQCEIAILGGHLTIRTLQNPEIMLNSTNYDGHAFQLCGTVTGSNVTLGQAEMCPVPKSLFFPDNPSIAEFDGCLNRNVQELQDGIEIYIFTNSSGCEESLVYRFLIIHTLSKQ